MTPLFSLIAIASATGTDPLEELLSDRSLEGQTKTISGLMTSTHTKLMPIKNAPSVNGTLQQVYSLMQHEATLLTEAKKQSIKHKNSHEIKNIIQTYQPVMDYLKALAPLLKDDPTTKAKLEKAINDYANQTATLLPSQDIAAVAQDGKDKGKSDFSDLLAQ
eukprot:NODE_532_length_6386_cov_0.597264.p3 type:complete len:162 gc:universal NODE_532_length_6386_cov_0.597264:42-527(+)